MMKSIYYGYALFWPVVILYGFIRACRKQGGMASLRDSDPYDPSKAPGRWHK